MPFTTDLVAQQVGDENWRPVEPLRYQGNRQTFEVPKDFVTDFASVPLPIRWLIPKSGRHSKAAVLHDYLWRHQSRPTTYADADGLFRRALYDLKVPLLRRWVMWGGVRWASLLRTGFRDGPGDLPRLLLVTLFPGLFVVASGVVVLAFLLVFAGFEWIAGAFIWALRRLGATKVKQFRPPGVVAHSADRTM